MDWVIQLKKPRTQGVQQLYLSIKQCVILPLNTTVASPNRHQDSNIHRLLLYMKLKSISSFQANSVEVVPPILTTRKPNELKTNNSSQSHQRIEVIGQTSARNTGGTDKYNRSSPGAETTGGTWQEHLKGNCNCWRLSLGTNLRNKNSWGPTLGRTPYIREFYLQEALWVLRVSIREKYPGTSHRRMGKVDILKYTRGTLFSLTLLCFCPPSRLGAGSG